MYQKRNENVTSLSRYLIVMRLRDIAQKEYLYINILNKTPGIKSRMYLSEQILKRRVNNTKIPHNI